MPKLKLGADDTFCQCSSATATCKPEGSGQCAGTGTSQDFCPVACSLQTCWSRELPMLDLAASCLQMSLQSVLLLDPTGKCPGNVPSLHKLLNGMAKRKKEVIGPQCRSCTTPSPMSKARIKAESQQPCQGIAGRATQAAWPCHRQEEKQLVALCSAYNLDTVPAHKLFFSLGSTTTSSFLLLLAVRIC